MSLPKPDGTGSGDFKPDPGGGNDANDKKKKIQQPGFAKPKFEGACEGLKGHIFDCSNVKQVDMFVAAKKALEIYIGSKFDEEGDIRYAMENEELPVIVLPAAPEDEAPREEEELWKLELKGTHACMQEMRRNVKKTVLLALGAVYGLDDSMD